MICSECGTLIEFDNEEIAAIVDRIVGKRLPAEVAPA